MTTRTVPASTSPEMDMKRGRQLDALARRFTTNPDTLLEALARVADSVPAGIDHPEDALSAAEEDAYRQVGGLAETMPALEVRPSVATGIKAARIADDGLTVSEAANRLKVTEGRIRQRITAGTLRATKVGATWRLPACQFTAKGELPGISQALTALPEDIHPVLLDRFLTTQNSDLTVGDKTVSPSEWLSSGGDPATVAEIAADLTNLP